jgi:uncharacterized phage-associated protein
MTMPENIKNQLRNNLDLDKYIQVILCLIEKAGGQIYGKKKLAKLLYFYEFDFFEKYEKPSINETFQKYPMGPLPSNLDTIISLMEKQGSITIKEIQSSNGYLPTIVYCLGNTSSSCQELTGEENNNMDRIGRLYIPKSGKDLENISHTQAPWNAVEMYQIINPELAFYRGTDFEVENENIYDL